LAALRSIFIYPDSNQMQRAHGIHQRIFLHLGQPGYPLQGVYHRFITNGSRTESSDNGTWDTPAKLKGLEESGSWKLWKNIAKKDKAFGNPKYLLRALNNRNLLFKGCRNITESHLSHRLSDHNSTSSHFYRMPKTMSNPKPGWENIKDWVSA